MSFDGPKIRRMTLASAEQIARDLMFETNNGEWNNKFTLLGAEQSFECEWVDPYFGVFKCIGEPGVLLVRDYPSATQVNQPVE